MWLVKGNSLKTINVNIYLIINPNSPELLESLKLRREGQMTPPPSEFTNYNPNAKTDVALYSQL